MLNQVLLAPFICLFVIPVAWLEGCLLPKATWTGWAAILTLVNALILYIPWAVAIIPTRHLMIGPVSILGFLMIAVGLLLLATALLPVLRVPGQIRSLPERLVVEGPYQWVRHPIYLSHFLLIGGAALACGALRVFLETPIVLGMAAVGGKYEESKRLLPLFGRTFEQYKDRTHFLLPVWGWVTLGLIYSLIAFRVFFS